MSTDTSLSDLISEVQNIPQHCLISLYLLGAYLLDWHTAETSAESSEWSEVQKDFDLPLFASSSDILALLFCLISPSSLLKILKQNPIHKDMVDWSNIKTYLFNIELSSDWHLTQSISAFRTDRQVRDKLTLIIKKIMLEQNDTLLF